MSLTEQEVEPQHLSLATRSLFYARGVPLGPWVAGYGYRKLDLVSRLGSSYIAMSDHVSSSSFTDDMTAGKWMGFSAVGEGDELFQQTGDGAVERTYLEKARDIVDVRDFGAACNGVTDDTTAWQNALASGASRIEFSGDSIITATLVVPAGVEIAGRAGGFHRLAGTYAIGREARLIFKGTGATSHSIATITGDSVSIANPDAGAAYLGDSGTRGDAYTLLDLSASFSCALKLGEGSALSNLSVIPYFIGSGSGPTDGYDLDTAGNLSDDWDVGIWLDNAGNARLTNVVSYGHWRLAACLHTNTDPGGGAIGDSQNVYASGCLFQGYRGLAIRGPDTDAGGTWGFAGSTYHRCMIRSLDMRGGHLATSSELSNGGFAAPSAALEMSGDPIRGVQFLYCTFVSQDDVNMFLNKCGETLFVGCYAESKSISVSGSPLANSQGSRLIATANTSLLRFIGNSKYAIDYTPWQGRDAGLVSGRYTVALGSGVCSPSELFDDDNAFHYSDTYVGPRVANNQGWQVQKPLATPIFTINDDGGFGLTAFSGTVTIADDAAADAPAPKNGGFVSVFYCGATEDSLLPNANISGLAMYDVGSSVNAVKVGGGANFDVVATNVNGTTGTDGRVTVGVAAGNVRIENRSGATAVFRYFFFG